MPADRGVDAVLAGRLGTFWEWYDDLDFDAPPPLTGWLRLVDGRAEVVTTAADDFGQHRTSGRPTVPRALIGVLEHETVLLADLSRRGPGMRSGNQPMLDTMDYAAQTMIVGVQRPHALISPALLSASVVFPGMLRWAGFESYDVKSTYDEHSRVVDSVIRLHPLPDTSSGRIAPGLMLDVETRWNFNEDREQVKIGTGLHLRCRSTKPLPAARLIEMLQAAQLALVLAYRGWIDARSGWAELDTADPGDWRQRPEFWSNKLMISPAAALKPDPAPLFTLADMNGARGMARWVRFCRDNDRIVAPLLSFHRNGSASIYDHINAMCSAIETLAASRSGLPGWGPVAGKKSGGLGKLHIVAARLGKPWAKFVGDLDRWANITWDAYLNSKHYRPGRTMPVKDLRYLTASAEIMLTAAVLDLAAGSRRVSRAIIHHYSLHRLGEYLRQITTT